MRVVDFLSPAAILPSLSGVTKPEVLGELASFLAQKESGIDAQTLKRVPFPTESSTP
jgi:hypothetical protein